MSHLGANQFTAVPWPERFWANVNKTTGPIISRRLGRCWLWTGATAGQYGQCRDPRTHKITTANRVAYILTHGDITRELDACHLCDVSLCVRPSHLFAATRVQNMQDASRKGRGNAKLSPGEVRDIRRRLQRNEEQRDIAAIFGMCQATISQICRRFTWKWV